MRTGFLQSGGHRFRVAIKQQRSHGVNRIESHASRGAGSENTVGQFFPKPGVRSPAPNVVKLTEPLPNLLAPRSVSGHHSFNCDGFLIALHCSLSIRRFYERAGNIVNELGLAAGPICGNPEKSVMMVAAWPRPFLNIPVQFPCIKLLSSRINYGMD